MDSITIDSTVYRQAEAYAQKHKLSVRELVERTLAARCGKGENYALKKEEELAPAVRTLIGIAAGADTADINGRDARDAYLREKAVEYISLMRTFLHIAPMGQEEMDSALDLHTGDVEDALQYRAALSAQCDALITRNEKHFTFADIPVYTPEAFLKNN